MQKETEIITIAAIELKWSPWYSWNQLDKDNAYDPKSISPKEVPGVYEVRLQKSHKRLTIGKTSNLKVRIIKALVQGKYPHSAGKWIRRKEDTDQVLIRWAETERRAAAEEALHIKHREKHRELPKYTCRT